MEEMQDTGPSAACKKEWAKSDITFSMELLFLKRQTKKRYCGNYVYGVPDLAILLPF